MLCLFCLLLSIQTLSTQDIRVHSNGLFYSPEQMKHVVHMVDLLNSLK